MAGEGTRPTLVRNRRIHAAVAVTAGAVLLAGGAAATYGDGGNTAATAAAPASVTLAAATSSPSPSPSPAAEEETAPMLASTDPVPLEVACPAEQVLPARFDDVDATGVHALGIDCLWWYGLTSGRGSGDFGARDDVSRGAVATLLVRLLRAAGADLPAEPDDAFSDDHGNVHEPALNTLAALDVVSGMRDGTVGPYRPVTRGQLASLLSRVWPHLTGQQLPRETDVFPDDDGTTHEVALDQLGTIGLLTGDDDGAVHPQARGTRAQLATLLARVLARTVAADAIQPPAAIPADPVVGEVEVSLTSVDPGPSVYAVDAVEPADEDAVDAFVADISSWLDGHLTALAAGDTQALDPRLAIPVTHERWRAATRDLLWRTTPADVRYRIAVTEHGVPQWASVEVAVTRDGRVATWELLVVPALDGIMVLADGPPLTATTGSSDGG